VNVNRVLDQDLEAMITFDCTNVPGLALLGHGVKALGHSIKDVNVHSNQGTRKVLFVMLRNDDILDAYEDTLDA